MTQMKHQTRIKSIIGKLPLNHQIELPRMIIILDEDYLYNVSFLSCASCMVESEMRNLNQEQKWTQHIYNSYWAALLI